MTDNLEQNQNEEDTTNNNESTQFEIINQDESVINQPSGDFKKSLSLKIILGIVLITILSGGLYYFLNNNSKPVDTSEKIVRIGLSMDALKTQRWSVERDIMTRKAQTMGATVTTLVAEGDDLKQATQIENFISQKMDVIIIVSHDATALSTVITKARASGIKVIDYDRLNQGAGSDIYLSFDSIKVGEIGAQHVIDAVSNKIAIPNVAYIAGSATDNNAHLVSSGVMSVLNPLIESGKINLVFNEFTADWNPDTAYKNLKTFLDNGGHVDAVIAANDGLAYGAVQALSEYRLAGSVPVSGQDGELQAMQRILQGTQTVSAYKPGWLLAEKAIEVAVDFANGKEIETNAIVNNGTSDVPSFLIDPIAVTKNNIDETVIKDGVYTKEQVYGLDR